MRNSGYPTVFATQMRILVVGFNRIVFQYLRIFGSRL